MKELVSEAFMKKQNILKILADEYIQRDEEKKKNFSKCIENWNEYKEIYIKSFLNMNKEFFKYDFDLNSNDEKLKLWSEKFYELVCFLFKDLISSSPNLYLSFVNEKDEGYACANFCTYVLRDNLANIRKGINKIVNE